MTDSVELALKLGEGRLLVQQEITDGESPEPFWLSERFACIDCGISLPPIEPRMFSFNGPHGACPACDGLGARTVVDPERVVGDPQRTLREGVVLAWGRRASVALATELARVVESTRRRPRRRVARHSPRAAPRRPLRRAGQGEEEERLRRHRPAPRGAARGRRGPRRRARRRSRRERGRGRRTTSSGDSASRASAARARAGASAPRRSR